MPEPIKALIFDAEGVVIDTIRSVWIPADIEFCRRQGFGYPDELKNLLGGTRVADGVEIIKKYFNIDKDSAELLKERLEITSQFFKEKLDFVPGFTEFFAKHKNLPAAIATSLRPEYLAIVENKLHLSNFFGQEIYNVYDTNSRSKPAPDVFLYAANKLGIDPKYCVVFEDTGNGLKAAKTAGMRSVGITTTFTRDFLTDATIVVDTYDQIDLSIL